MIISQSNNLNAVESTKSLQKLSSGLRINKAGDDAAGLTISEKMRAQIRGLNQAERNTQDGISLLQVADGALNEIHNLSQRIRELIIQKENGTNNLDDVNSINTELEQSISAIRSIKESTNFNGIDLLKGKIDSTTSTRMLYNGVIYDYSQSISEVSTREAPILITTAGTYGVGNYIIDSSVQGKITFSGMLK